MEKVATLAHKRSILHRKRRNEWLGIAVAMVTLSGEGNLNGRVLLMSKDEIGNDGT